MKKILAIMVMLLMMGAQAFAAETVKIGFINLQQALNDSKVGKQIKTELETIIKSKQDEINSRIDEKDRLQQEYEKQAVTLSEQAARQRLDELQVKEREIDRLISDYKIDMQKVQREREISILKDLDDIITKIGKAEGYTIILPIDVILYHGEGIDITSEVITTYDRMFDDKLGNVKKEGGKN